jgi:hypothetical protein
MAGKHISILVHFVWNTAGREPWITSVNKIITIGSAHSKRSLSSFSTNTTCLTMNGICGIDNLYRPFGPRVNHKQRVHGLTAAAIN